MFVIVVVVVGGWLTIKVVAEVEGQPLSKRCRLVHEEASCNLHVLVEATDSHQHLLVEQGMHHKQPEEGAW